MRGVVGPGHSLAKRASWLTSAKMQARSAIQQSNNLRLLCMGIIGILKTVVGLIYLYLRINNCQQVPSIIQHR